MAERAERKDCEPDCVELHHYPGIAFVIAVDGLKKKHRRWTIERCCDEAAKAFTVASHALPRDSEAK